MTIELITELSVDAYGNKWYTILNPESPAYAEIVATPDANKYGYNVYLHYPDGFVEAQGSPFPTYAAAYAACVADAVALRRAPINENGGD